MGLDDVGETRFGLGNHRRDSYSCLVFGSIRPYSGEDIVAKRERPSPLLDQRPSTNQHHRRRYYPEAPLRPVYYRTDKVYCDPAKTGPPLLASIARFDRIVVERIRNLEKRESLDVRCRVNWVNNWVQWGAISRIRSRGSFRWVGGTNAAAHLSSEEASPSPASSRSCVTDSSMFHSRAVIKA